MTTVAIYKKQIIAMLLMIIITASIMVLDRQAQEIRRRNACIPVGLLPEDAIPRSACTPFLAIETVVETLVLIFIGSFVAMLAFNTIRFGGDQPASVFIARFRSILERISKHKAFRYYPIATIISMSLLIWRVPDFFGAGFIANGDAPFPFTAKGLETEVARQFFLWHNGGLGLPLFSGSFSTPYFLLMSLLDHAGVPLWAINRLVYILPSFLAGCATYYLASHYIKGEHARLACTIAACMAVVTPAQVFQNPVLAFGFASVPLTLGLFVRGLAGERKSRYALAAALSSAITAMSPFAMVLTLGIAGIYLAFYLARRFSLANVRFAGATLGMVFLANFFWIYPLLLFSGQYDIIGLTYSQESQRGGTGLLESYAPQSDILYTSRLITNVDNGTSRYFDIASQITALSIALPVYAYLSSIIHRDYLTRVLAGIAVMLTVLSTGLHYPVIKDAYLVLWHSAPYFSILNSPYYFLYILAFLYSVMIGITTWKLLAWAKRHRSGLVDLRLPVLVFAGALVVSNGGMALNLAGEPNYTVNYALNSPTMKIPQSYYDLQDFLAADPDSLHHRVLVLPYQGYVVYNWFPLSGTLLASGVLPSFTDMSLIGINPDFGITGIAREISDSLKAEDLGRAAELAGIAGVKYVVVSKDLVGNAWAEDHLDHKVGHNYYIGLFSRDGSPFRHVKTTDEFVLYRLDAPSLPRVFASLTPDGGQRVDAVVRSSSSTEYVVDIQSPSSPYYLVLNESFNENWQATIDGEKVEEHTKVNGFANAWRIDRAGGVTVKLEYLPQSSMIPAYIVSTMAIVLATFYLVYNGRQTRRAATVSM